MKKQLQIGSCGFDDTDDINNFLPAHHFTYHNVNFWIRLCDLVQTWWFKCCRILYENETVTDTILAGHRWYAWISIGVIASFRHVSCWTSCTWNCCAVQRATSHGFLLISSYPSTPHVVVTYFDLSQQGIQERNVKLQTNTKRTQQNWQQPTVAPLVSLNGYCLYAVQIFILTVQITIWLKKSWTVARNRQSS